jgi:hypothetical protein
MSGRNDQETKRVDERNRQVAFDAQSSSIMTVGAQTSPDHIQTSKERHIRQEKREITQTVKKTPEIAGRRAVSFAARQHFH